MATAGERDRRRELVLRSAGTVAKRNGREHERQAQKALPGQIAHGFDKSTSEVDLPAPQFHASHVPGLRDTRQGLRTQPGGPQKQTGREEKQKIALGQELAQDAGPKGCAANMSCAEQIVFGARLIHVKVEEDSPYF